MKHKTKFFICLVWMWMSSIWIMYSVLGPEKFNILAAASVVLSTIAFGLVANKALNDD